MKKLLMIFCAAMAACEVYADSVSTNGYTWTYSVSGGGATLNKASPLLAGDVEIPSELNGCSVVGIATNAFKGCVHLSTLIMPSSITSVGIGAFDGCSGLTNVVIETDAVDCVMPGLLQAKFNTRFDVTSPLDDAVEISNVSGTIAAYTQVTSAPWEFLDPVTGQIFKWEESNSTFVYGGQMYLEEGKTYVFGVHFVP